ncbi:Isochorismate synthase [Pseudomonas savastanoi pv. glycinea]|uniref:isochorismate synthase n=2 Tax=Pseudomonas savastanoi pv. glycinea TaxID=318 RepID=A0A3M3VP82_PSESG|nr:isochorismate synthase [Pseudomonas savastanoi]EFW84213.1 salicylate biosynthesis isochorismate synthase [Pseudomonas savastanoi pv. glycinea str. race 4]EGH16090.1 salicylate biosynthesis isochorismate synthase [Pseudomonas savastanoi pv. glycinea str. race 4]MCQ3005395.1 isochorismate synthase [Pseudomonas savastanoi]RMM99591.1 Salicylate biosynthesis isochorismate synthase [Pseudomonas savastanoi pv. glycinea]RMN20390.1 Salicylate biosynthesis isochorismate synthase [Pseudomonas savastan
MSRLPSFSGLQTCLQAAQAQVSAHHPWILASFSTPSLQVEPLGLFTANREQVQPACLWCVQAQGRYRIGLGLAHEFNAGPADSWQTLEKRWRNMAVTAVVHGEHRPTLFGGFAFDRQQSSTRLWRDFPDAALTLPRFELRESDGRPQLIVNVLIDQHSQCDQLAGKLVDEWVEILGRPVPSESMASDRFVRLSMAHLWKQDVFNAVNRIKRGGLKKVVLARSQNIPVVNPLLQVMQHLMLRQPNAYLFAFARGNSCFLGASPECLLTVQGDQLHTMALAGTAPRGTNSAEDARLGEQLLASEKDNSEHAMVIDCIRHGLVEHCLKLDIACRPRLHKLPHIQHLLPPVQATLAPNASLLGIVQSLHPTPAVGGLPRNEALDYIRSNEQLDRGWYAGPIGWLDDQGNGELAVALRSALLTGQRATLFAGCGLVSGSEPESEYRESDLKMQTMREALGQLPHNAAWM